MDIEHSTFRENIPAYALGALDADEAAALESHLRTCDRCRAELAGYRQVGQALLAAVPPHEPPRELRKRLRETIAKDRAKAPKRAIWSFGQLAMGLTMLLLLGLNVFSFLQLRTLQQQQAKMLQQAQTDRAAMSMLAYPATISLPIEGGQVAGTVLLNKEQNTAMLIVWDLPQLPQNETYQAWLVQPDGVRVSAAIFSPDPGEAYTAKMLSTPQSLNSFTSLGVTVEPAGGSSKPTGQRILKVDF